MESQEENYIRFVDQQIEEIVRQQSEFFVDRELVFLQAEWLLNDYERRNALLSVQEKLIVMIQSNPLIHDATLFIPNSNYVITESRFSDYTEDYGRELKEIKGRLNKWVLKDGELQFALSEAPYAETIVPFFYLNIVLDQEELIQQMNTFITSEGGVCWYNPQLDWFLEDTQGKGIAREIIEKSIGEKQMERVKIDHTYYLLDSMESAFLGTLVQYYSEENVLKGINRYSAVFYGLLFFAIICALVFSSYTEKLVNRPLKKLLDAFGELRNGNMTIQIQHPAGDEFAYIYEDFNHMVGELNRMIEEVLAQKNLAVQAELRQLQAQISPHFLYNSFLLFSSRVRRRDYEGAGQLAEYLGTYFRYLARNTNDIVTLKDEMEHAQAYARIQESRFVARITLEWKDLPEGTEMIRVPRLILQPILENAFKYGLEDQEDGGILRVYSQKEKDRLIICVENSGPAEEKTIRRIQGMLSDSYEGEVTGMINVHRRIKYYFKGMAGLSAERAGEEGIVIQMILPIGEEFSDV